MIFASSTSCPVLLDSVLNQNCEQDLSLAYKTTSSCSDFADIEKSTTVSNHNLMCSLRICFSNMAAAFTKSKPSKQTRAKLDSFVAALNKKGIKLLALDFDKTIIDIHSGGVWDEGVDKLALHVRPCMKDLMEAASNKGLYVAIVTYHRQAWLIKEVLQKVLSKKIANKTYIQANTTDFLQRHRATSSSSTEGESSRTVLPDLNGKQAHIAAVINDIYNDHGVAIKKEEIVLMDDDINNIRIASSFGHYAFQVQQSVDYPSFESFETMLLL